MSGLSQSFNTETASPSQQEIDVFLDAARRGNLETISQMLDTYGQSIIEVKDSDDTTALIWAAWSGQTKVVFALLDKGADIEARSNNGSTALIIAAWMGHAAVVSTLLDEGADIEAKDNDKNTALIWAASIGHTDVQTLLHHFTEKRIEKLAFEEASLHSGIHQAITVGSRLVLQAPAMGGKL